MPDRLGVLLLSGRHDRAHYAFVIATAAAALGRDVTLFATNGGCRALLHDWASLEDAGRDGLIQSRGVAGLDVLRAAAAELPVRLMACEAGLLAEGLEAAGLLDAVQVAGVATFLEAVGDGQIVTC
jgi:peroxiredoxin family protein